VSSRCFRLSYSSEDKIDVASLYWDVGNSLRWQHVFSELRVRGFSFVSDVSTERPGGVSLRSDISLAYVLLARPTLYYGPRVRTALHYLYVIHRNIYVAPSLRVKVLHKRWSICWALAKEVETRGKRALIVVNIQSDLASHSSSALRYVFRGWQRVLLWNLLNYARCLGFECVAVPTSHDIHRATAIDARDSDKMPVRTLWAEIYDKTCGMFGMRLASFNEPIDIQTISFRHSYMCRDFFVADLRNGFLKSALIQPQYSDQWVGGSDHQEPPDLTGESRAE
jgi:hypothetical protein